MPRLRPPPNARPISPAEAVLALLDRINASTLSDDAKAAANMLALNNLVLGRLLLSGRRVRHRVPSKWLFPKVG